MSIFFQIIKVRRNSSDTSMALQSCCFHLCHLLHFLASHLKVLDTKLLSCFISLFYFPRFYILFVTISNFEIFMVWCYGLDNYAKLLRNVLELEMHYLNKKKKLYTILLNIKKRYHNNNTTYSNNSSSAPGLRKAVH